MQCFDIKVFSPKRDDKFLLDTNVLIFLFSGFTHKNRERDIDKYQNFFDEISTKGCDVFITSLNLYEYENVYRSLKYNDYRDKYDSLKDFRNSSEYAEVYRDEILPYFEIFNKLFNIINIRFSHEEFKNYLNLAKENIKKGQISFDNNDFWIAKTAQDLDLYLITDDKDFIYMRNYFQDLKILTANKKLLDLAKIYKVL